MHSLIWFGVLYCMLVFLLNLFREKNLLNKHKVWWSDEQSDCEHVSHCEKYFLHLLSVSAALK